MQEYNVFMQDYTRFLASIYANYRFSRTFIYSFLQIFYYITKKIIDTSKIKKKFLNI